ncbi:ATP-dependent helicase, partial [Streptomyces sp. SID335]|nr:ATP-dependent helicase [Streptomyces sp. SID335]
PFAAREPQHLPGAREWAAEVAAGMDAGVRVSLRLDLRAHEVFDGGESESEGEGSRGGAGTDGGRSGDAGVSGAVDRAAVASPAAAVVQVHSLADPALVADVPELWAGTDHFGPRARVDTL